MAIVVQAYTLVSILAPNSLEAGIASVQSELISIPTIFFDTDPPEESWGYVAARTINPVRGVYNATYSLDFRTADLAMAWRTYNADNESAYPTTTLTRPLTCRHAICDELQDPYANFSSSAEDLPHQLLCPSPGWLFKQLSGSIDYVHVQTTGNGALSTDVMTTNLFSLNDTARTFSENTADIKGALERMLVNATVALISSAGETTTVDASVARDLFVWVYDANRLWIIYSIALGVSFVCGVLGIVCIIRNGEAGDIAFSDIAKVTRNTELDDVFGEWVDEDTRDRSILQYGIRRRVDGLDTSRIFQLVKTQQTDTEHGPA
ncbi:hypothetical protein IW261DRAFT_1663481 [Armillaria novae-zelandiae]|uniref:Uncharacterized protein n=1 Tax=Armillaria novae-zelandiae TaxID=153914 RepID=A0AA39PL70_9AGAR|nr:hypothetical protein IW261DRAFT_1663481 [Armillaria novae-zelandiae]